MGRTTVGMLCAVGLVAVLAACGRDAETPMPTRPFTADGVQFSLTPSAARDCAPGTAYTGVLSWSVQRAGRVRLEIRVDRPDGTLFARSNEASGSARTGEWVGRGMWFLLIDRDSGELLAAQRAGPQRCD